MQTKSLLHVFILLSLLLGSFVSTTAFNSRSDPGHNITIIEDSTDEIILKLVFPKIELMKEEIEGISYDRVIVSDAVETHDLGYPTLPMVSKMIGLPPGANVSIRILSDDQAVIEGPFNFRISKISENQHGEIDSDYQSSNQVLEIENPYDIYPITSIQMGNEAWLRDQRVLTVNIFPVQYDHLNNHLVWHKEIVVQIDFNASSSKLNNQFEPQESFYEKLFEKSLINYQTARNWRGYPSVINRQQPEISTADRLKIVIKDEGVYRIRYSDLAIYGLKGLNPDHFRLSSQGSEASFFIENDDGDHLFDEFENILFWGEFFSGEILADEFKNEDNHWLTFTRQLPDGSYENWKPELNSLMVEKYTKRNVYWLSWNSTPGTRMQIVSGKPKNAPILQTFRERIRAEENNRWRTHPFTSEETWYWDRIQTTQPVKRTYPIILPFPNLNGSSVFVRGELLTSYTNNSASPDHHIRIFINGQNLPQAEYWWDGQSRLKFEFQIDPNFLVNGTNNLVVEFLPTANLPQEEFYFDWYEVEYDRELRTAEKDIKIQNPGTNLRQFEVNGLMGENPLVLDIENPYQPQIITDISFQINSYLMFLPQLFGDNSVSLIKGAHSEPGLESISSGSYSLVFEGDARQYYAVDRVNISIPDEIQYVKTPNYLSSNVGNYLVITPEVFYHTALEFADYRELTGYTTSVVKIEELYNEFTYGIPFPLAVKSYLNYLLSTFGNLPEYMLLVGDGHWNLEDSALYPITPNFMSPNLAWVDPWQGEVDSANLLATVVGDDPLADLSIGRLPVNSEEELRSYIEKIKVYDAQQGENWQSRFLFVADNTPDSAGDFVKMSDDIINTYIEPNTSLTADRIYVDNFCDQPSSNPCPVVNHAITSTLNSTGTLIMNYIGHGSVSRWAHEQIFINADIGSLNNSPMYPIVLSMTCLDGYWIYPGQTSIIEELVRVPNKGAVASFSPTGLGVATGHDVLHRGFYNSLFVNDQWHLGLAADTAKLALFNAGYSYDLIHTFTVFGDPALVINGKN